jgi:hypothetical protein
MSATSNHPTIESQVDQPSVEERRALIERVAGSEQFSRSARLRDFLLYVGKQSLKDGRAEIHEQEIGAKVFGRSSTYDRSQDNIVRVNATELRKRIDLYFTSDGVQEPLILEIPRGAYKLVFRRRLVASEGRPDVAVRAVEPHPVPAKEYAAEAVGPVGREKLIRIHMMWGTLCLLLLLGGLVLYRHDRAAPKAASVWDGKPAIAAFWGGFLRSNQQTDIVLPDDSASVIEDITHRPLALPDYLTRDYMRQIETSEMSADRKADLYQIFNHNLVTFGGVRAAQQIQDEIPSSYPRYLTLTRYYTADEIKRNNVVLIGGKKSVPWDHLFDDKLNFITDYDDVHSRQFVSNRNPKPGEQTVYAVSYEPNSLVGYSVVAYLPNPSGTGNAIILAGTDSDATGAAAEFLTSEAKLEQFRSTLRADRFPYFEVLLKTSRLSGTSFNSEVVAYRTYPDMH